VTLAIFLSNDAVEANAIKLKQNFGYAAKPLFLKNRGKISRKNVGI